MRRPGRLRVGGLALGLAIVAISWGSILVRLCVSPPPVVAFYRLLFASGMVLPAGVHRLHLVRGKALGAAAVAGMLLALHFGTWMASLRLTGIAASTVLVSTQPLFSMLLSGLILKEPPPRRTWAALTLALAGTVVIAGGDLAAGEARFTGDLLALLGAVFAAAYLVVGRAARAAVPFATWLLLVNAGAAAAAALGVVVAGGSFVPAAPGDWRWFVLMAAVPHVLGHGALNWSVRRLRAYVANLAVLGEPVLASLYAFLLFNEAPPPNVWAGGVLVAAGVGLALRDEARRQREAILTEPPKEPR